MQAWTDIAHHFSTTAVAHLATLEPDGAPQVVPLWIDRHGDDELVFFTIAGSRKDRNIGRDPRVAVSITAPDDADVMATVLFEIAGLLERDTANSVDLSKIIPPLVTQIPAPPAACQGITFEIPGSHKVINFRGDATNELPAPRTNM